MRVSAPVLLTVLATILQPDPARAQANANPVKEATDGFGFTNGDEAVGVYDTSAVRGFDLEAAGNYRVNGAYFVKSGGVSSFFLQSTTVRIGPNALNVDFPGPSGVVDYRLRDPGPGEASYVTVGLGEFEQPSVDVLLKHHDPADRFSATLGVGLVGRNDNGQGARGEESALVAGMFRGTAGPVRIRLFGGDYAYTEGAAFRFTFADPHVRPEIRRRHDFIQDWATNKVEKRTVGVQGEARLSQSWTSEATVIYSDTVPMRSFAPFFSGLDKGLEGESVIVASPRQISDSWSEEARLSWSGGSGALRHLISAVARGRQSEDRFGGDQLIDLGQVSLAGEPRDVAEPALGGLHANLRDEVTQWGAGLSYRAEWKDRGVLNLGLLHTDYTKRFVPAGGLVTRSQAAPLLLNIGALGRAVGRLDLYGSYSRGLEEAGRAPDSAANRNAVLPAIRVTQKELGLRYALTDDLRLVLAGFETTKPYAGLDPASNRYELIGAVRHRGMETSLSGRIGHDLTVVLGGYWLDPRVTRGGASGFGLGARPVGVERVRLVANVNYDVPRAPGLTLDAGATYLSSRPFQSRLDEAGRQPTLPSELTVDLGLRYRLPSKAPTTLRLQVLNVADIYGLEVDGAETLAYQAPRRFRLQLTREF